MRQPVLQARSAQHAGFARREPTAKPDGALLTPPLYGVDFVDRVAHGRARASAVASGGLPEELRAGVEALSGFDMSDVRVHRDSRRPADVQALAFTQGSEIHLGPGQEEHLPHEAWHVVQQKQGRVRPTLQAAGVGINDDSALEREADGMGARAARWQGGGEQTAPASPLRHAGEPGGVVQRVPIWWPQGGGRWDTDDMDLETLNRAQADIGFILSPIQHRAFAERREALEEHAGLRADAELRAKIVRERPALARPFAEDRTRVLRSKADALREAERSDYSKWLHLINLRKSEINCVRCAVATERALRFGEPEVALSKPGLIGEMSESLDLGEDVEGHLGGWSDLMEALGGIKGRRAIVNGRFPFQSVDHAMNVIVGDDGEIIVLDGQEGRRRYWLEVAVFEVKTFWIMPPDDISSRRSMLRPASSKSKKREKRFSDPDLGPGFGGKNDDF